MRSYIYGTCKYDSCTDFDLYMVHSAVESRKGRDRREVIDFAV